MDNKGDHFLVPLVTELSTLELMSRETYRLAEVEIRPHTDRLWHLDTYGIYGLRFYSLSGRGFVGVDLPEGSFASDLTWSFKAGIAGDGAYNRSLTPAGFQAERRSIWEAPQTYIEMSPFFKADQINTPLLMYHGGDDNNTGTFPMQSERMIQALTTLGKPAVLYVYPYESHTPRAIENKLDMWARFIGWFDEHVKDAGGEREVISEGGH